jgi:hypothetical protein
MFMPFITPTHWISRYSNTLLVTLNNRIYFRDHPFPGSTGGSVSQPPPRPSEHPFPQVQPIGVHVFTTNDTFGLDTLTSTTEQEKGKGNDAGSNLGYGALFSKTVGIYL